MSKRTSVKLIAILSFILCLVMAFGITAYADNVSLEDAPAESAINKADKAEQLSECSAPSELEEGQQASLTDPASETPLNDTQNDDRYPGQVSDQNNEPTDSETPTQSETREPTQEPEGEGTAEEPDNNQDSENSGSDDGLEYSITISDANGSSVDVTGGTQTLISDVLRNLGYEIGEDAIIEVEPDSVDTNVVNVTENGEGELVLTDNGPFGRAVKNLIVYVNGVAIELELVDPSKLYVSDTGNDTTGNGSKAKPYQTIAKALTAEGEGNTIFLLSNIVENITIAAGQSIVLNLNGNVLSANDTDASTITVCGTLKLIDSSTDVKHYFTEDANGLWIWDQTETATAPHSVTGGVITGATSKAAVKVDGGTFTMKNGNIVGNSITESGAAVYVDETNGGAFNMAGGLIAGNVAYYGGGVAVCNGSFNMSGGEISGNAAISSSGQGGLGGGVLVKGTGSFTMTNGKITGNNAALVAGGVFYEAGSVSLGGSAVITGNTAGSPSFTSNLFISNGNTVTVKASASADMIIGVSLQNGTGNVTKAAKADNTGYFTSDNAEYGVHNSGMNKKQQVYIGKAAVQNTDTGVLYESLQDLINAVTGSSNVTLNADVNENITVANGQTIILDLNGKTLSAVGTAINNSGNLTVTDSSTAKTGKVSASGDSSNENAYGIYNNAGAVLNVENAAIESGNASNFSMAVYNFGTANIKSGAKLSASNTGKEAYGIYSANSAAVTTVTGGEITAEGGTSYCAPIAAGNGGKITVEGSETKLTLGTTSASDDSGAVLYYNGIIDIKGGMFNGRLPVNSGTLTVTGGKFSADPTSFLTKEYAAYGITETPYTYEVAGATVHDGTKGYASVQSAINANSSKANSVANTVTLTMLDNANEKLIVGKGQYFILDLNGKTLSASGIAVTVKKTGNLTVTDNSEDANGLIKATGTGSSAVAVKVADSASFTLLKGTLSAATTGSGKAVGVYTVGSGSISLKGGKVEAVTTGTDTASGVASSEACTGKITVDGAAISAASGSGSDNTYGIIINGGSLEFNSGSVSAATDGNGDVYGIYSNKSVSVSGGNISAKATGNGNAHGIRVNKSGSAIVTGGTVKAESAGTGTACGICAINKATVAVSGNPEVIAKSATAGNNRALYAYGTGTFTVSGGRFNGPLAKNAGSFDISGGKFSDDPTEFLGTSYAAWNIKEKPYFYEVKSDVVAYDDLHGYSSVQKAFNFNKDRAVSEATRVTVTMAKNSQEDVTVKKGTFFTLDLNGCILRGTGTDSVVIVRGNLILTDSNPQRTHSGSDAALPVGGAITGGTGKASGNKLLGGGVFVSKAGTLTMRGGTVTGNTADYGGGVYNKGTLTVTGGRISGNTALSDDNNVGGGVYVWAKSKSVSIGGNVIISDNSNKSGKADNVSLHGGAVLTVLDGFNGLVGVNSDTAPAEYSQVPVTVQNGADYSGFFFSDNDDCLIGNYKNVVYLCAPVAELDGTQYGFIQEAIDAAGTKKKTVKLISGSAEDLSIGKNQKIVLDLNGKFLHGDINVSDNGELTVIDKSDSYGGVKGHLSKDNGAAIRLTAGVYSEMPNEAFLASGYWIVMNTDPETMDEYPFEVEKRYDIKLVDTTDEGCSAKIKIVGTVASIWVVDKDNKAVAPANVTILEPGRIMQLGAKTAEIRMTDKLTVVLDIKACMCGKSDCVITIDNVDGVITVRCDGDVVFTADLTDILDKAAKLVYDGETIKAYDADGKLLKEFKK